LPELPDITVYIEALEQRIAGHTLERVQIAGPSLLRTASPPVESARGHRVAALRRIGKRIAIGLDTDDDLWLVLHLMIAGRLHWKKDRVMPDGRRTLAAFDFDSGTLTLTEAGARKRASLYVVAGEAELKKLDPGGIDVLSASLEQFSAVLTSANHTLKRALTDPRLFSGIGNAYSDETLRAEAGGKFPERVTAFLDGMAVHGRYGEPCPRCGAKIQRIRYAANETNYCARCQTGGKLLADRSLSRLLREDWPRSLEELEELRSGGR